MFRRRRPLMRAAVVGGGAYVAGKKVAQRSAEQGQQENEQDERLATLEEQASATPDPPAQDAPAAAPSMPDQLSQLAALHEQGALTDDEFATAKARLLGELGAEQPPDLDPGYQGRLKEHRMSKPFKGTINVDIRDSVPDWEPFEPPKAPDGAPSVVYIVLDDVGFSAMSCYGGPIETPNIDRIANDGIRYTQWHTTALCSPTRSCLLTGRNHTRNSMACITEAAVGFPNASGTIPPENGMLSEILGEQGWNTYMVGKWHLCPTVEMNVASTRRNWPSGRGFERWYGFLGAETNQWYPDLVYDNHPVDQPKSPAEGYHLTEDLTDKALEFIKDAKAVAPDKPYFLYYAPGAAHAPHHVSKEWADKFKGRFDMGYEAMREQTLARQKQMGIVPADTELPPVNPIGTPETRQGPDGPAVPATGRHPAVGFAVGARRSGCSRGWPRSTPGSWPTPTTTSAGCSTTWRSPGSGRTRW